MSAAVKRNRVLKIGSNGTVNILQSYRASMQQLVVDASMVLTRWSDSSLESSIIILSVQDTYGS